jgi:hypothetical protein
MVRPEEYRMIMIALYLFGMFDSIKSLLGILLKN